MTNKTTSTRRAPRSGGNSGPAQARPPAAAAARPRAAQPAAAPPTLDIPHAIVVHDLAVLVGRDPIDVIKQLMRMGLMHTINEVVDYETAATVARAFGFTVNLPKEQEAGPGSIVLTHEDEDQSRLITRPPVVTILGHVDHGKTTLLDAIRKTKVAAGESGGITQHIGAYQVRYNDQMITFLDTPGHEAFTAMRARGAKVTDVAVLVVAADDGIMPQTDEAISHVKAAGVPIVVAINKVDRPDAEPERIKRQLAERDLLVEDWGGDVISVAVSALKGDGIDNLLENILVVSELADLKANPDRLAKGVVVEASIDKSKGSIATVLVQTGTLRPGDMVVVGGIRGRIKAMIDDRGKRVKEAGPSTPVEILGLSGVPSAGDSFVVAEDDRTARAMVELWEDEQHKARRRHGTLEDIAARIESGEVKGLNLIIKTDVQGSIEAVRSALENLNTDQTRVNIIHMATGTITESDVLLAVASDAIIMGFNSQPQPGARMLAGQEGVDVRNYDVIYSMMDDVQKALKGLLAPAVRDVVEGYGTVRAVFMIRKNKVAGIYINNGRISRSSQIHVIRNNKTLHTGPIESLKHFKDDVREIGNGQEGGLVVEGFQDYLEGDIMEAHRIEEVPQS